MTVSVLILTLNEEVNIEGCLDSLQWADDVVVLDSFSSDRTAQIAASRGARVIQREFDNYASQRNFGLQQIQYKHEWLLMIDADERVTPELRAEIAATLPSADPGTTLYAMRRKDFLLGRWIRRSSGYPTWFGRLVRVGRVWVERAINEEYHTDGKTLQLREHLDHFPFNKGFSAWFVKHDRYSSMEASMMLNGRQNFRWSDLWCADAVRRRRALKGVVYAMPARPLVVFVGLYIVKGGVLDGRAGLTFSLLRTWYEFMIDCKRRELQRRSQQLPV